MLAPWCERESAEETVLTQGIGAADWWEAALPAGSVHRNGTLVVAQPRDGAELKRFASRTSGFRSLDAEQIAALEPALAGRFRQALFFPQEAHLDPRRALSALRQGLAVRGAAFADGDMGILYQARIFEDRNDPLGAEQALNIVIDEIWREMLGFAGIEIHRRILGLAHNADFETIADPDRRAACESKALKLGRHLAVNRHRIHSLRDIRATAERLQKETLA